MQSLQPRYIGCQSLNLNVKRLSILNIWNINCRRSELSIVQRKIDSINENVICLKTIFSERNNKVCVLSFIYPWINSQCITQIL